MSITDELREWWLHKFPIMDKEFNQDFVNIADRIDKEHERKVEEMTSSWDHWEYTHVELPKDADGEPIHIGDELDGYGCPTGGTYCKAIVNETMILAGAKDSNYTTWLMWDARSLRHHKQTVEDVLDEFASAYDRIGGEDEEHQKYLDLIAEYAAKLQLRGDGE